MRSKYWTDEEDAILKEMVLAGAYYSVIGEKLGRGKNAVISRAKRMGFAKLAPFKEAWNKNMNVGFGQKASEKRVKTGVKTPPPSVSPSFPLPSSFHCDPVDPSPDAENLSFAEMSRGRCWFPEGDDSANLTFCGAHAPAGSSWCAYHRGIVFVPYQPRKHREGHWK